MMGKGVRAENPDSQRLSATGMMLEHLLMLYNRESGQDRFANVHVITKYGDAWAFIL